jgi:hypothetical protein
MDSNKIFDITSRVLHAVYDLEKAKKSMLENHKQYLEHISTIEAVRSEKDVATAIKVCYDRTSNELVKATN